eukprot:m.169367 g.169367  ORF g.169367 m.169367 type:complete len:351 (-) comp31563_c0_seq2:359-1411(-)
MDFFGSKSKGPKSTEPAQVLDKPWVEKYRPKSVDDVAMQDEVVSVLKTCLTGGDMPHLLFYGPPGTGKTSTILAICRQLYGPKMMKDRVLELNASDERGISVVRDKIKNFAQLTAGPKKPGGDYPCPAYKIIIMDECDSMTGDAQSALRRTMEAYSKVTRFCLICNYVSRIIDPLASRCAKFRFKSLSVETQLTRIRFIQSQEGFECSEEVLQRLVVLSGGDMRQAITLLQSCFRLKGGEPIEVCDVEDAAGIVPTAAVNDLVATCHRNSYEEMQTCVINLIAAGYAANFILTELHDVIMNASSSEIGDIAKAHIAERLAKADSALVEGADEHLQLLDVGAKIMSEFNRA